MNARDDYGPRAARGGAERRQPSRKNRGAKREPYIRLDEIRYTWQDVLDMEDQEICEMLTSLDEAADSIESTLESLAGDQKVRAQDKMRHCRKWAARIRDEVLHMGVFDDNGEEARDIEEMEELEGRSETCRLQLQALKDSVRKHLSPELAAIIFNID